MFGGKLNGVYIISARNIRKEDILSYIAIERYIEPTDKTFCFYFIIKKDVG